MDRASAKAVRCRFESGTRSMKKIVYIAHPISGDIEANLKDLCRILRIININSHPMRSEIIHKFECGAVMIEQVYEFQNIIPQAPYYHDIISLDDSVPLERIRGRENDIAMIKTGVYDELWFTGDRISKGMEYERQLFIKLGKPVINYIGKF